MYCYSIHNIKFVAPTRKSILLLAFPRSNHQALPMAFIQYGTTLSSSRSTPTVLCVQETIIITALTSILTTCIAPNHLGCTRRQTRPTGTGPFGDVPSDGTTLHVHKMSKMLTDLPFGSSQVVHPLTRWNVLVAPYIGRRTSLVTHSVGFGWTRKPGPPRGTPAKSPSHHNSQTLLRPERHESGAQSRPVVSNFDPRHVKGGIGRPHLCQRLTTRGWGAFYGALPDRSRVCNLKGRLITLWEACRGSSLFL